MDLWEQSERILMRINEDFAQKGDPARIRYFRIIADPYNLDGWVVLPIVELPLPGDGDDEVWPREEMFRYRNVVRDRFFAELGAENLWVTCLFRSPEELRDPAHRMGAQVPAA